MPTSPIVDPHMNNAFEYGPDPVPAKQHDAYISYTHEAVMRYRVGDIQELINDTKKLVAMINHHRAYQAPRLEALEQYYFANNPAIMSGQRRRDANKSDHRIRNAFACTISDFLNAYTLSNPVKISDVSDSEMDTPFLDIVQAFGRANDIDAHNLELGRDQNNMGRAYELLQRTEEDQDKVYLLDPRETFMIFDRTVRSRVIGACRYYIFDTYDKDTGVAAKYRIELYTGDKIYRYEPTELAEGKSLTLSESPEPHLFGGVPIIEYRSDRYMISSYERELSQIDAYDAAQSDTANYMTDFNDAMLAIRGRIKNADDSDYLARMLDANILIIEPEENLDGPSTAEAGYLVKSYDVQGVEAYKDRLKLDILSFANTPNLTDESFSGNQSGEALKWKMFGLQQKCNNKERFFAKGLRVRYKLLENLKRAVKEFTGDPVELGFSFTPNQPAAYLDELEKFTAAGGRVSEETMLKLLSFIDDPTQEMQLINNELKGRAEAVKPEDPWEAEYDQSSGASAELRAGEGVAQS